ncbi:MAG: GatB/YqeY domain-containing protein, partial [Deltaproteobacteria bacterium]|nr:GatB/YqeY domain-containing protein [Deltaproteobacteria bacterium]
VLKVISTSVKQHKESIEQFKKGGREDLVAKEQAELEILEFYLPQQLSEEEINALIKEAIEEVGATSMKDMGKIMKYIMPKTQGRADGKMINQLVKKQLS